MGAQVDKHRFSEAHIPLSLAGALHLAMGKRAAPSPAGGARKKTNADPVAPKCKDVSAAISKADLPSSCKEMLTEIVHSSLAVFAADRHAYQTQAVKMLEETLEGVHAQMRNAVSEAQAKVDNADREKASRAAVLESAEKNLTDLEQSAAAAKDAVESSKAAGASAKANSANAQAAVEGKDAEVAATRELKAKLESALKDAWEPSKISKASAKCLHALEKVLTDVGVEAGLVDSLPDTLKKDPEARGTFDGLVVKHVEDQTAQYIAKTDRGLKDAEQSKVDLADAKAAAEAALAGADEKSKAASTASQAAEVALKEGKAALKQAQAAVVNFEREMSTAGDDLEEAKAAQSSFADGTLQSFAALKALAPPPEPEPELAEAPVDGAAAEVVA